MIPYHKSSFVETISPLFGKRPVMAQKEQGSWTYFSSDELRHNVKQISRALSFEGIQAGDRILTSLDNSWWWYCWDLAIGMCGAIHVPLSGAMHPSDIQKIAVHCEPSFIAVLRKRHAQLLAPLFSESTIKIIVIKKEPGYFSQEEFLSAVPEKFNPPHFDHSEDDIASIIYRSDTLDHLNGVMLSHKAQLKNAESVSRTVQFHPLSTYYQFLPVSSAFVISSGYIAMLNGMTTFIWDGITPLGKDIRSCNPEVVTTVPFFLHRSLAICLRQQKKTGRFAYFKTRAAIFIAAKLSPSISRLFGALIRRQLASLRAEYGTSLRKIICGGALLPEKTQRIFHAAGLPIFIGYGMTEAGTGIAMTPPDGCPPGSVGRVIDVQELKTAPDGEILCKSETNAFTFFRDQGRNSEIISREGFLHTGDIGYSDQKGFLFLTGRKKPIFKVSSGVYIEPQNIRKLLIRSPLIRDVRIFGEGKDFCICIVSPANTLSGPLETKELMKEINFLYNDHVIAAKRIAGCITGHFHPDETDDEIMRRYSRKLKKIFRSTAKSLYL
jgi:long-chain acyl-CoA synthetase